MAISMAMATTTNKLLNGRYEKRRRIQFKGGY
ncbi:hypothetical protein SAMN05444409_2435 [Epilithonimonas zeae]|uniref:Uncharacterized protein n=1 Tax=Epilithonimonas zeae TaxID=1416779 RepID=A0A1N6HG24_9FLAO|nr:hypothetical protein SAMN05444409_2435 [Epilithonimonas zeae]